MGKSKILIVDDEPKIRLLVSNLLGKNYKVIEAGDGEEAIGIARRQRPDLILMDIMMPKLDGYTACHALKTHPETKVIPVIMLTGIGHAWKRGIPEQITRRSRLSHVVILPYISGSVEPGSVSIKDADYIILNP